MQNFLSRTEREDLKNQHRSDKRVCDRIKAILLLDEGWSYGEIAHALLLSDETIRNHLQEYRSTQKLKPQNGGSSPKLREKQAKALLTHLEEHTYLYVKDIVAYVSSKFGILYTVAGMKAWLKTHGFTYKKPSLVPGKANRKQQEEWLSQYYRLKQNLTEGETICFIDGVHPTHNVELVYGWIKKGVRKEIPSNTGRGRLNLTGSIDILNSKILIQEDQTLNAESTIQFFRKIENARYYRNKKVKEYLKDSKIELHFLPPYSPNLNPIERLWKWMKEKVLYINPSYKKVKTCLLRLCRINSHSGANSFTIDPTHSKRSSFDQALPR